MNAVNTMTLPRRKAALPASASIPTGIVGLDEILGGGLPPQSNILLYGDPLSGKKPLGMQYVYEGLRMQIPGIFVLTDFSYLDWKSKMAHSGWDLEPFERTGMVQFIDCYSRQFDPSLADSGVVSYADSPAALSSISLQLARVQDQLVQSFDNHRLLFHSISSLLKETDSSTFFRFLQFMVGKFRREGATAMYTVEKGMHDEKDIKMIEHFMDGVIEFEDGKITARGLLGCRHGWQSYTVSEKGVEIRN